MSSMFGGGFKSTKCKTLLRLAMARIKLLRNKRDTQVKQMRKDIAQLLTNGHEPSARIRVEHIAREQNIMDAYDILELFCELIIVRLPIIESHKVCPLDLKEGISSLIFASPRCADLPELSQIRSVFASKYGKEFVAAAIELRPECGVNRRIIEKLSVRAPSGETKLKLLKEIAEQHNLKWDPADSEAELMKKPEDLLGNNMQSHCLLSTGRPEEFFSPSTEPLPEVRCASPNPHESVSNRQTVSTVPFPSLSPSQTTTTILPDVSSPAAVQQNVQGNSTVSTQTCPPGAAPIDKRRDYEYDNLAAATKAAAEFADRAVEAASVAAELAKSYSSKRESQSRFGQQNQDSKVSSEEENSEEEQYLDEQLRRFSMSKHEYRQDKSNGSAQIHESSSRRANTEDSQEGSSMSRSNYGELQERDQNLHQGGNSKSTKRNDSVRFDSSWSDEEESLNQRYSALFYRRESSDELPPTGPSFNGLFRGFER